jgi:hypothetical protein
VSVPLVHRHGPCAPLQTSEIPSFADRLRRSRARANYIRSIASKGTVTTLADDDANVTIPAHLGGSVDSLEYVVAVGLGTPAVSQVLLMDTGSDLSWARSARRATPPCATRRRTRCSTRASLPHTLPLPATTTRAGASPPVSSAATLAARTAVPSVRSPSSTETDRIPGACTARRRSQWRLVSPSRISISAAPTTRKARTTCTTALSGLAARRSRSSCKRLRFTAALFVLPPGAEQRGRVPCPWRAERQHVGLRVYADEPRTGNVLHGDHDRHQRRREAAGRTGGGVLEGHDHRLRQGGHGAPEHGLLSAADGFPERHDGVPALAAER